MARRRGVVCDYAGEELHEGDLIAYASRCENGVRLADGVIEAIRWETFKGRRLPFLSVQPTGVESGYKNRRSQRRVEISADHARLIRRGFAPTNLVGDPR